MKIQEPWSTTSSTVFIGSGIWVGIEGAIVLGISLVMLGVYSALFHASGSERNTREHRADEAGIYAVSISLPQFLSGFPEWILVCVAIPAAWVFIHVDNPRINSVKILTGVVIVASIILALRISILDSLMPLGLFAIAIVLRVLGENKILPDVTHAGWHIFVNGAITLAWYQIHALPI